MTLLEKMEAGLSIGKAIFTNPKHTPEQTGSRYGYFDPLTINEVEEIIAALRTVAEQR